MLSTSTLVAVVTVLLGCLIVIIYAVRMKRVEMLILLLAAILVPVLAVRIFSLSVPIGFGIFYLLCGAANLAHLLVVARRRGSAALATLIFVVLGAALIVLPDVNVLLFLASTIVFLVAALISPFGIPNPDKKNLPA